MPKTSSPQLRRQNIDDDLPGSIKILHTVKIYRAKGLGRWLHRVYERRNFRPRGAGRNAGRTEYFRLNLVQALEVRFIFLEASIGTHLFNMAVWAALLLAVAEAVSIDSPFQSCQWREESISESSPLPWTLRPNRYLFKVGAVDYLGQWSETAAHAMPGLPFPYGFVRWRTASL